MARLLVPLGSCSDALAAAPLVAACRERGIDAVVAWCGRDEGPDELSELGLPPPAKRGQADGRGDPAAAFAETAAIVGTWLAEGPWAAVLSFGHGTTALAAGLIATRAKVPVVRFGAGQRSHDPECATERDRRIVDHAADTWFVAHETHRTELLREGLPGSRIFAVGSLLPAALRALPMAPGPQTPFVWFALEHAASVAERAPLQTLLEQLALHGKERGVVVRCMAHVLGPALERFALTPPPGLLLHTAASAREQLDLARAARGIVTDSAGYQELAAVLGVRCVLLRANTTRPETVAAGAGRLAPVGDPALPPALAWAFSPYAPPAAVYADALVPTVGKLQERLAPGSAGAPPTGPTSTPFLPSDGDHTGRTLGNDEVALVAAAIRSGTLNSTRGTFVTRFEREFAHWLGRKHAIACGSGSAAVHAAIAALGLAAGDEVVTTPITDMGAITPILYEGGVPVFADVDPDTWNVTAATLRAQITPRTRALVVTHLFGMPCDMAPIVQLAQDHGLPLIEDAAQAFGATCDRRKVGTFGAIGTFSLQQGKHITSGEGGIVATDDDALARRLFLFVNKAWGYGDPKPDHTFPALNGRLTELQGAVLVAQLPKLDQVVAARREVARQLRAALADVDGLRLPGDPAHGEHSWWKFALRVDANVISGGAPALGKRMQASGVACVPRYIQKPAFECALFQDWAASPVTALPLQNNPRRHGPMPPFVRADYPGAVRGLEHVLVLPINERYTAEHVRHVAAVIRTAAQELQHA